jgi:hypothetical protein
MGLVGACMARRVEGIALCGVRTLRFAPAPLDAGRVLPRGEADLTPGARGLRLCARRSPGLPDSCPDCPRTANWVNCRGGEAAPKLGGVASKC